MPLHPMARTTRRLAIGGGRTEPLPILGGLPPFSTSHGHHRHPLPLDKVFRLGLGEVDEQIVSFGRFPAHTSACLTLLQAGAMLYDIRHTRGAV